MNWLFGGKKTLNKLSDKVWIHSDEKLEGLLADLKSDHIKIVCSFFDETINSLSSLFKAKSINFELVEEYGYAEMNSSIYLFNANFIKTGNKFKDLLKRFDKKNIQILFCEHYPLFSKEKEILDKLESQLNKQTETIFYSSLDEPIFLVFEGDRMKDLLQKLGLGKGECIQHPMITNSITNLQKKIESQIRVENKTESYQEWFLRNKVSL